jgi:hypothetical protein
MEQGTLLSDLGDSGGSDQDLVQSIMRDINGPSQQNPLSGGGGAPPPPQPGHIPIQRSMNSPNPNSYMQHTMDHQSGQGAHMIGGARPTPADFATLMGQGYMMANGGALPPASAAYNQQQESGTASKWMNWIFNELRIPLFVAIVFFIFSLPTANVAFAHIFPSMVTATGNMTILGQLTKAGLAGVGFWLLHRVLAPLVG